jgi:hypothetical protein
VLVSRSSALTYLRKLSLQFKLSLMILASRSLRSMRSYSLEVQLVSPRYNNLSKTSLMEKNQTEVSTQMKLSHTALLSKVVS